MGLCSIKEEVDRICDIILLNSSGMDVCTDGSLNAISMSSVILN